MSMGLEMTNTELTMLFQHTSLTVMYGILTRVSVHCVYVCVCVCVCACVCVCVFVCRLWLDKSCSFSFPYAYKFRSHLMFQHLQ